MSNTLNACTPKTARMRVAEARTLSSLALAFVVAGVGFYFLDIIVAAYVSFAIATIAVCVLQRTGVYRISGGKRLDDMERDLRAKAYQTAYYILGGATLLLFLTFGILSKNNLISNGGEIWGFLFWCSAMFVVLVPVACLSWKMPTDEIEP
jgi:hypothetical protein